MKEKEEIVFVVKYQPLNENGGVQYIYRYIGPFTIRALAEECLCALATRVNVGSVELLEYNVEEAAVLLYF